MRIIDLSTPLDFEFSVPQPPFINDRKLSEIRYTNTFQDSGFIDTEFTISSHTGTHVVAPMMVLRRDEKPGKYALSDIPLEQLYGWTVTLDVPKGEMQAITADDLEKAAWTIQIKEGDIVLIHTGWGRYFVDEPRNSYYLYSKHPGLEIDGAEWLVRKRIKAFGIDTMNVQCAKYSLFLTQEEKESGVARHIEPIHRLLLQNDIVLIEQLRNLDKLVGRRVVCGFIPLPFKDLEASPIRAVAFLED